MCAWSGKDNECTNRIQFVNQSQRFQTNEHKKITTLMNEKCEEHTLVHCGSHQTIRLIRELALTICGNVNHCILWSIHSDCASLPSMWTSFVCYSRFNKLCVGRAGFLVAFRFCVVLSLHNHVNGLRNFVTLFQYVLALHKPIILLFELLLLLVGGMFRVFCATLVHNLLKFTSDCFYLVCLALCIRM